MLKFLFALKKVQTPVYQNIHLLNKQLTIKNVYYFDKKELFNRLGGTEKVNGIVDYWIYLCLQDQSLAPFFKRSNVANTKKKKKAFMCFALGGALAYSGRDMGLAHLNLKMSDKHFESGKGYFDKSLQVFKVSEPDQKLLMEMFESYRGPCLTGCGPLKWGG